MRLAVLVDGETLSHFRLCEFENGDGLAMVHRSVIESLERVPQKKLGETCRRYFDWVKDDYADGHVHADNRFRN